MSHKKNSIKNDTGFLGFYEFHQRTIELTTAISPELERYSAKLKELASNWLDVGITFIKKSEIPSDRKSK